MKIKYRDDSMLLAKHGSERRWVVGELVQELLIQGRLAGLESEGPGALHWLPCWVSKSSAGPITQ